MSDQQALVQGSQYWLILSVAAVLPILWAFTLALHFARPYVIRYLQSLTLRFGGDVWWLSYILMRDGLLVVTFALSVIFLFPNLYMSADLGVPITAPLAALVLFWALLAKLTGDSDDDARTFRIVSVLLVVASMLYIIPQVYGVEAGDQVDALNSISSSLGGIPAALVSGSNPNASYPILNLSLLGFAATGAVIFAWFLRKTKFEPAEIA
jgi:multisubunit Na+/H+ antiporter MnhF subunit